ncbi:MULTISPECIES: SCP2 sterol-binding domain-containing protein [Microvirgula]|uniref:SCP2 domain-containing protein n=1 Tax=Microvirgula aerodenitrificans TaxID=57480 RepID=A0A2S0PAZ0_9NEIS|nr:MULTISPECIES: SCP2 sterol-binding domain-containing protein [Microvirgula]AVY94526.1 hypothetical protein DAI18_11085 [Microvirgula aerodenitrificans]RAS19045.1 SCP-2 sterol transfer family protein [Microvirgula sp. AG722]
MALPSTLDELFAGMPARLQADKAAGVVSRFHFKLSGEPGGEWTVALDKGQCQVEKGLTGEAKCVVEASGADYLAIERGELRPEVAFMQGKIKLSNLPEMMTLMQAFSRPA